MIDLSTTYQSLAPPWTHEQLADRYQASKRRGEHNLEDAAAVVLDRPIAGLATAIPPTTSLSVAIHVLHVLPSGGSTEVGQQLLDTAGENAANALQRCHRALELDGHDHEYTPDEWLTVVYDTAGPLLESARPDQEPPSAVQHSQAAVSWLARATVELDQDSPNAPEAITKALARLLVLCVFADAAGVIVSSADG